MRLANIIQNDVSDGIEGMCVSVWTQGCPHRCPGCHNAHTWDFNGGIDVPMETIFSKVISMIETNGIKRNLSILGGEPLCDENKYFVRELILKVKEKYPTIKITIWTGYTLEELKKCLKEHDVFLFDILKNTNHLIDGRFVKELYNPSLILRGSSNQRIFEIKNKRFMNKLVFKDITKDIESKVYSKIQD